MANLSNFAVAVRPTVVLNTPNFPYKGKDLPLDNGHLRAIEFVALVGTKFQLLTKITDYIWEVQTNDYPTDRKTTRLFADIRSLQCSDVEPPERPRKMPSLSEVKQRIIAMVGAPYVWGGNWSKGLPYMLEDYPPSEVLDTAVKTIWTMSGVDCSGLGYEATDGCLPRNSGGIAHYGIPLPVQGKSAEEIAKDLKPMDTMAYRGHVIFDIDEENCAESIDGDKVKGVRLINTVSRLEELMQTRKPINDPAQLDKNSFVVVRWHPEMLRIV